MQIFTYIQGVQHNLIGDISDNGTALFSGGEDAEMPIADSSYRFSEIMGDDNCIINFSLPVFYEFSIGCFIIVDYTAYTLLELGQVTKQNERWYDYTLTFESPAKQLSRYKFRNYVDGRLNFTITAQPQEFLDHICRNMNMDGRDSGWTVGDCIVSSEKTQSFSHNTVADALNSVAQLFETEWEIIGKRISLRKIEYNKTNPLTLSYGMGNGFKSGITRQLSDEKAVDVLWVEGGDRNIDGRKYTYRKDGEVYHANKLRLPRDSRFVYIPSNGEPDASGKIDRGQLFTRAEWDALTPVERSAYAEFMAVKTDADGFGVERETRINNGYEESLEATDIYPHKVLQVASAVCVDAENRFWDITAKTQDGSAIPNYNECLIGGVTVTTVFNSGMLSGKEFNIANQGTDENPIVVKNNIFKIQPTEIDGIVMPDLPTENDPEYSESGLPSGTGYVPHINDEFGIFHVFLPNQYVEEAERELLLTACEYLWKHGEVEVEFNGTVDGIWAKNHWDDIFPYIKLGGYIRFYDNYILGGADGKLMRILNIKQYINNPHSPEITLSNSSVSQGVSSEIKKIPQNQVAVKNDLQQQISYTERSFRDTKETQKALEEAIENIDTDFTESISPVSVQTMQMIVGSENLQFAFGSATTTPQSGKQKVTAYTVQTWNPTYANGTLVCTASHLKHYTIAAGTEITSGAASVATFPYWAVSAANLTPPDHDKNYYLYAVCPKSGTQTANLGYLTSPATFILSDTSKAHTNDNYYFLVGILNKVHDGTRSFASCYGFTEIMGNRISTDRIVSADGNTYIDLVTGEISSNKAISFKYNGAQADLAATIAGVASTASSAESTANTASSTATEAQQATVQKYGVCGTGQGTAAKTVTLTTGKLTSLAAGVIVTIKFSNKNTAANPTLNVNSLGAKTIVSESGTWSASNNWTANQTFSLTYDGANWIMGAALAQAAADAAASAAQTAQTASSNASTALSTANTASTNASTALSTANTAKTTADNAASAAQTAQTAANNAATTANEAKTLAQNIKVGGRNLLRMSMITVGTNNGITATKSDNGWVLLSGTFTRGTYGETYPYFCGTYSSDNTIAKNGIYTLSVELENLELTSAFTVVARIMTNEGVFVNNQSVIDGVAILDLTDKYLARICLFGNSAANGKVMPNGAKIRAKLEKGNQATDWTPAPEDVDADIASAYDLADTANTAAGNAATAAAQANTAITTINTDNVFSIIEKKTIRIEWYAIHGIADTTSAANASGSYQKALTAASETDIATSTLTTAYTTLKNYLNTNKLYTQENTTGFNRTTLSTYFTAYYNAETALYDAIADYYAQQAQAAAEALAAQAQLLAECSELIANGYLLYRDSEFTIGYNGLTKYTNSNESNITIYRNLSSSGSLPNASYYYIHIVTSGSVRPGCGGVKWNHSVRKNASYVYLIRATIPVGYKLNYAHNGVGNEGVVAWATSQNGEGTANTAVKTFILYVKIGQSGTIGTQGFFYLTADSGYSSTSVYWDIVSAAVYDATGSEALKTAYKNSTDIKGGVVLTNVVQVQDNNNDVTAGMNGLNPNTVGKNPRFWAGGSYATAVTAASQSDQDIPSTSLPILLTDNGYNSNIGIFKVLENAIAVMRSGQVIRISTDKYDNEKDNVPIAPVTRTLATNKQLDITKSNYNNVTQTWNIGTFPKQASFDISIPSISIVANMYFSRVMYTTGNVTGSLYFTIEVLAGGKSATILDTEISATVSATSGGTYSFSKNQTLNTTAKTINNVLGTSSQYIQLKITSGISTTGSGATVTECSSYVKTNAALTVTVSENQSCFILAKGGFACAQTSTKSLLYDAAAGTFDYNGTTFKINGRDFLNSRGQTVTTGSGYVQLSRIGQVVTCKLNIPKANLSSSAIIPSGYRPTIGIDVVCTTGNSSTAYLVTIGATGSITSSALPNNTVAYGVVSYVTADAYPS